MVACWRKRDFGAVRELHASIRQRIGHAPHNHCAGVQRKGGCSRVVKDRHPKEIQPDSSTALRRVQINQHGGASAAFERLEQFDHGEPLLN